MTDTRSTLRDALAIIVLWISLVWLILSPSLLAWWLRGLLEAWAGLLQAAAGASLPGRGR